MHETELATARPRRITHQGVELEVALHVQRYCPLRGCFVIQSRRDPSFLLETMEPVPVLQPGSFLRAVNEARTPEGSHPTALDSATSRAGR